MSNEALVVEYQKGNDQALNDLVIQNEKLVYHFANRYYSLCSLSFLDKDDLIQEGFIGLMEAAEKYDPDRESSTEGEPVKFSSYASQRIMGRIFRAANKHVARDKKSDTFSELINVNSIHEFVPGSDDITYEDTIADRQDEAKSIKDFEHRYDNAILKNDLLQLLDEVFGGEFKVDLLDPVLIAGNQALLDKISDGITPKEVLLLHYGLLGKMVSYITLAEHVGITVQRLSQIEFNALQSIRTHDAIGCIIDQYGEEYRITKDNWFRSIKEAASFESIEDNIRSVDELLDQILA